eukprot:CAMPEP_0201549926 /NCGR_PEP_ID=MMETSP0173_2-20130828/6346_1 /ASSEMBLY_ACC=CAM_ASM_000268 /TAXON_ID=218659 /ORGANISM="Vexillifera sp., Strain DIVA3 564/2" /LENGTH=270 /DNA_ID=CAMNT_0047959767 /DNA_START=875 /DNA_END=1687 /DNA_ORIENTATION=+
MVSGLAVSSSHVYVGVSRGYNISGAPWDILQIERATKKVKVTKQPLPIPYQLYLSNNSNTLFASTYGGQNIRQLISIDLETSQYSILHSFEYEPSQSSFAPSGGDLAVINHQISDPNLDIPFLSYHYSTGNIQTFRGNISTAKSNLFSAKPLDNLAPVDLWVSPKGNLYATARDVTGSAWYTFCPLSVSSKENIAQLQSQLTSLITQKYPTNDGSAVSTSAIYQIFTSSSFFDLVPQLYVTSLEVGAQDYYYRLEQMQSSRKILLAFDSS